MINEEIRPMSHRETINDYQNYVNKRKAIIAQEKKEEFENSLRESATREIKSNSGLFGSGGNMFEQKITKDISKSLSLMERKRKMQINMATMINDLNEPDFLRFESVMTEYALTPKTS
jgi:hypothetical protein